MDFRAKGFSAGSDPCLSPLFQGHSGAIWVFLLLNVMVHPWTRIIIHTRETGTENPHWKQFLTAIPSSRLLPALTTDRENAGYTQNSAPPPACRHRIVEHLQLEETRKDHQMQLPAPPRTT